jgi:hypothetical protein
MTLSDDALKLALLERVRVVEATGPGAEPPAVIARWVAAGGRPTLRDRWIGRPVAVAAGLVATAVVVVIGSFLVARLPAESAATISPGASTSAVVSTPPVVPSVSIERSTTPSSSNLTVGCDSLRFDARRCAAMIARAREQVTGPGDVIAVSVEAPVRSYGIALGGGAPIATVDFTLDGGLHQRVDVSCGLPIGPVSSDRVCSPDPQVVLVGGPPSHDTPCGPNQCDEHNPGATPPPTPEPAVVAASEPLVLRTFDVVVDHVGHYEVLVGRATLPDGLLSERSGDLADPRPTGWWIDSGVSIVVRPGKPCVGSECPQIDSIYRDPFHGPQPVNVYLVFDVVELTAPVSILEIRNLVVR